MTKVICRACGKEAEIETGGTGELETTFAVCRTFGCDNENDFQVIDRENNKHFTERYREV